MEDVLAIYEKPLSERENRWSVWMKSRWFCTPMFARHAPCGRDELLRRDCEYERRGTANVFCGVEPKAGRHFTKPTSNRCSPQFADYLVEIVASYPEPIPSTW
jgi:hypothetical protein